MIHPVIWNLKWVKGLGLCYYLKSLYITKLESIHAIFFI